MGVVTENNFNLNRIHLVMLNNGAVTSDFEFLVNPQNYSEAHTARTYLQQTRTANTVQNFGEGPATISIAGHFGDKSKGYNSAKTLKSNLENNLQSFSDNNASGVTMQFKNYTLDEFYNVVLGPEGFSINLDAQSPTIVNYQISFIVVGDMSQASTSERTETILGNNKSSLGKSEFNTNGTNYHDQPKKGKKTKSKKKKKNNKKKDKTSNPRTPDGSSNKAQKELSKQHNHIWGNNNGGKNYWGHKGKKNPGW